LATGLVGEGMEVGVEEDRKLRRLRQLHCLAVFARLSYPNYPTSACPTPLISAFTISNY